jgi:hypothetical protein
MAEENSSPKPPEPIRARRWSKPVSPRPARSYRLSLRLIGIPAVAVVGLFIYNGLRNYFILPECDSERAKQTLSEVLKQMALEPTRYAPIKTVSTTKDEIVCNAMLPLPDGANVTVDYSFYWRGNSANMKYSVARKAAESPAPAPPSR